jgi:hypothetical protein
MSDHKMDVINQHLDKENIVFTNNSKTNSIQGSWEEFKLIRKTVSSKLDESHQNYISQLLEVGEAGERKTPVVLAMHKLKEKRLMWKRTLSSNGKNMEDSKSKAEALIQQCISFSQMKIIVTNQPELQPMQSVSITTTVLEFESR